MQKSENKRFSYTLKGEYAESYYYLKKLGVSPHVEAKNAINSAIYEKAREYKYKSRQQSEKTPFDI